jgi:hypothetical protein
MQRLLGEAVWDADKVRDDVRQYVADEFGDCAAVLIVDDTGDLKKNRQRRCATSPHRYRGTDRERADRCVPGLRFLPRLHTDQPGDLPAAELD